MNKINQMERIVNHRGLKKAVEITSVILIILVGRFFLRLAIETHQLAIAHIERITERDTITDIIIGSLFLVDALIFILMKKKKVIRIINGILLIIIGGFVFFLTGVGEELSGNGSFLYNIYDIICLLVIFDGILLLSLAFSPENKKKEALEK